MESGCRICNGWLPTITKKAIPTSMWCSGINISEQWSLLSIQASRIKSVSSSFGIPLPSASRHIARTNQQAKEHLSAITDEMIDEFEKYMEQLHPQEYRRLREAFGRITDDELGTSPLDSVVGAMKIAPFLSRLFALKEKMPKKGRLYYKLLPEDVKVEVDAFVAFLKENNEYIRNLVQDYVESKTRLAMLYDTDPTHIKEQQEKAVAEADKLIANKILDVIRTMLCKDREVQSFEYTEARKAYFTEQMICEILIALEQAAMSFDMEYDDRQKAMSTELSKAARKEWYLRHKDKGVEP